MSASRYKPYPEYKESEMKWESSIPKKWKKVRLRFLGKTYGGLTGKKGEDFSKENIPSLKPYIPYTNILNQTYISKNHFDYVFIDEGENQNLAKAGDLFFLMSSESYQDLGKSSILIDDIDELYLNSFCKGFRISESMIDPLFLNYQLQGHLHKQLISTEGKGFTRINLSQERLLDTPIFIPTLSEQEQITNFLDTKIPTVNHTIEQLENILSKIEEKRSALITQVVTKGLNPNVTMKESGIEWIGQIPEHWEMMKIKHVCQIFGRIGFRGYTTQDIVGPGEGAITLSPSNIVNGIMNYSNPTYLSWKKYLESPEIMLEHQDVLMVKTGSTFGRVGFVDHLIEKTTLNPQLIVFKKLQINKEYFYYLMSSRYIKSLTDVSNTGSTIPTMSQETISNFIIPVPPRNEIYQIVEHINNCNILINEYVLLIENNIKRLKEYRIALISAAVTGKIDVRSL